MTRDEASSKACEVAFSFQRGFGRSMTRDEMFEAARLILRPIPRKERPFTPTRLAQIMKRWDLWAVIGPRKAGCCENEWCA